MSFVLLVTEPREAEVSARPVAKNGPEKPMLTD
jgi:hypothetical protein